MSEIIIVSSCLAGVKCRYDGNDNSVEEIIELVKSGKAVALCPEVMGKLLIPRASCEIVNGKIITKEGKDCTAEFKLGAQKTLEIAKILESKTAILKQNSPSCGFGRIYDGTFTGNRIDGNGVCAQLLSENGIKIFNEDNYHNIIK